MNKNQRDLYWRNDDEKGDKNAISRELVCNFDGQGFYLTKDLVRSGWRAMQTVLNFLIGWFFKPIKM